jgi:hypothetical protein
MQSYGIRLLRGREIAASDGENALPVILVNEAFARRFFPGEEVVGRTVTVTACPGAYSLGAKTIVGLVGDSVYDSVRSPVRRTEFRRRSERCLPISGSRFSQWRSASMRCSRRIG